MREWGAGLMAVLPRALDYVVSQGRDVDDNKDAWLVMLFVLNCTEIVSVSSFTVVIEF